MRNIIYFTTALDNEDYSEFTQMWDVKPNPSNQNFHYKLIKALSITHHVDVISLRPFSHKLTHVSSLKEGEKVTTSIHWHYLRVKNDKVSRLVDFVRHSLKICKQLSKDSIVITDTINPNAITCASTVAKKLHFKTVGLSTDSPSNITGTNRSYTLYLLKLSSKLNAYISLTEELNELFNTHKYPSVNIEGIVDDFNHQPIKKLNCDYFFFGGSLLKRYGIYDLISAFKSLRLKDIKLVICGHHEEKDFKQFVKQQANVIYLDTIPVEEVIDYESFSIANINPRPYSEDLDRYSIPSKTIEYLGSGRPTISVKNSKLNKIFQNDCIWAKSSSKEDLAAAITKLLELSKEEQIKLGLSAKEKVYKLYSLKSINKIIDKLLETL